VLGGLIAGIAMLGGAPQRAAADTLYGSLALAYVNNPQLNSQRAIARQTDEAVPQALSGYRPTIAGTASIGAQYQSTTTRVTPGQAPAAYSVISGNNTPNTAGVTIRQTLFNGFQTGNRTRSAEQQVSASRETLRLLEQTVLLDAATAYMNLL